MEYDGNLVLYGCLDQQVWSTGTSRQGSYRRLIMQTDANLVIYDGNSPVWASNTVNVGSKPYRLHLADDGELTVYGAGSGVWSGNTRNRGSSCTKVSGWVTNAATGKAITNPKNVSVYFSGASSKAASISNGSYYSVELLSGSYTVTVKADRYNDKSFASVGVYNDNATIDFPITLKDPNVTFTLTWGATPKDLDLEVYDTNTKQGIDHKNQSIGKLALNGDDENGNGPEVVTLSPGTTDTYRVDVKRYSQEASLASSDAKLEVVAEGESRKTMTIPANTDAEADEWTALSYNAGTGEIKEINTTKI
jgi:hypothetical protein